MIGVHQPAAAADDAVAVGVGVVGEGDVEPVLHRDQPGHRIGRGAVHADLAVPVRRHEGEGRVERLVDDGRVQAVALDDRGVIVEPRPAERIDADGDAGAADRLHVENAAELGNIGLAEAVAADML